MAVQSRERSVRAEVQRLAGEFRLDAHDLAGELTRHLHRLIPELGRDDAQMLEETRISCEANLDYVFELMATAAPVESISAPAAALDYARSMVRRNVSLAAVLRAYRLGHEFVFERVSDALRAAIAQADELATAVELCSSFMFGYVDRVCDQLVEEYDAERSRWVRSAAAVRTELVHALLAREPVDRDRASASLGYELRRHHVAFVIWADEPDALDQHAALERAALAVAAEAGCVEPLIVASGTATLWAWAGSRSEIADPGCLEDLRLPDGVRVAVGLPGNDVSGFRSSHIEAAQAYRLARMAGPAAAPVTCYREIELASLLSCDLERARGFVARELGSLAGPDQGAARLRETLRLYLHAGGSHVRTARVLHVHQNTVAYRIRRAEELLGRQACERRLELEAALLLAACLGELVLPAEAVTGP